MSSGKQARLFVVAVLAGMAIFIRAAPVAHAQAAPNAVVTDPGCTANVLPRNDDDYSGPVPLGFDFFFGNEFYSSLRISNNGYVTFGPLTPTWFLLRLWELFNTPLIALFHADVDTRGARTSPVTFGPITFAGRPALCINWVNVGYFDIQDDRLNKFQLILVDRRDAGVGDVDIYMNYDRIEWDVGAVGAPRVGIYDGNIVLRELAGSLVPAALLDGGTSSLAGTSLGSAVLGRYLTEMRGGLPPETAIVTGTVLDTNGAPVPGAPVQACDSCPFGVNACVLGSTDSSGRYSLSGFAQADIEGCAGWHVTVSPPAGSLLLTNSRDVTFTTADQIIADADIELDFPEFVPSGTSITPSRGTSAIGVPTVYWAEPLTLTTTGCSSVLGLSDPIARYMITQDGNQDPNRCLTGSPATDPGLVGCGPMTETPLRSGTYVATVPALAPAHGQVTVTMFLTCPDPDPNDGIPPPSGSSSFSLYIDPSGLVLTTHGAPLEGAQVTLYRAESPLGPFDVVPDGSALMSPMNRSNPTYADAVGHFGWDTVAGYYVVRAEYPGCISPVNPLQTYVETDILPVPPEWTDLRLILDCEAITPPELGLPAQVLAEASSTAGAQVSYEVSAQDGRDGVVPVACSPQSGALFPVGVTLVTCSASDSSGNTAHGSFPVIVSYGWSNVLSPLRANGGNLLKRGRGVPVKFALTGASAGITNVVAQLYVAPLIGGVPGPESPADPEGNTSDGSRFRYDAREYRYLFNWSTRGLAAGDYQLRIDLGDGVSRTVPVTLR